MNLQEFCVFIRRQYIIALMITVLTVAAAGVIATQQQPSFQTTLLYAASVESSGETDRSFDITKAADDFARTVAGWAKSPAFSEKISALAEISVSAGAAPQAKQNLLVFLSFAKAESADRITSAAAQVLQNELNKYNRASESDFALTRHGESTTSGQPNFYFILAAAGAGGLTLAIIWLALQAYFGGQITTVREAEKILRTRVAVSFRSPEDPETAFLNVLINKLGKHAVLAGADINLKKVTKNLSAKSSVVELPQEAETLGRNEIALIVVVKLDTTRLSTLRQIRALTDGEIRLAVWR